MTTQNAESPFTKNPKDFARVQAKRFRRSLDHAWILAASAQIAERVLAMPEVQQAPMAGCYLATHTEVQTRLLIERLAAAGKRIFVPAWNRATMGYAMSEYAPGEPMHAGHLGVQEPMNPRWAKTYIDIMLVPVVAFDRQLNRLGHGGGNFDRLLSSHAGTKIGLAFEGQRLAAVPFEPHDVPLNFVVTEQRLYDGRNDWAGLINAPAGLLAGHGLPS